MDSLKLDRFRRLLNRQNTSINLSDSSQQQTSTGTPIQQSTSNTLISTKSSGIVSNAPTTVTLTQSSLSAIAVNPPDHIFKDNPRPAHFIARKLFCDFTELISFRVDTILANRHDQSTPATTINQQHSKDGANTNSGTGTSGSHRSIFESLQRDQDLVLDQILRALSTVSEHCLPSLLKYLLLWYHQQLEAYAETYPPKTDDCLISGCGCGLSPEQDTASAGLNQSTEISLQDQQPQQSSLSANTCDQALAAECGCISPCNTESHSLSNSISLGNNPTIRSPTPSSPDTCGNQISITSTLPLDYQSPVPLTTIIQKDKENECQQQQQQPQPQQQSGSAANTSTSTNTNTSLNSTTLEDSNILSRRLELTKIRTLLIDYAFCQALIEIFSKLYLHPGHEDLIGQIEDIAFEHFRYEDETSPNGVELADIRRLSHKYADLIGVLAQTRFKSVKKRFFKELADLKLREPTTQNIQSLCSLLAGMRSFRIKMAPIEEFEASFQFLQELADYFIEVRHKSIKHALAELFVEILLPLASTVKNEVKIPCLKNFVDTLWTPTLDMCARKKHSSTIFPLVTCLLCLSQRAIFLQNWSPFLQMCLSSLKNRDQKMCRIALESLYRLIWIYMIRIKGESNNITQARLNSIVDSLFPRGSRQITPRDTSLVIFVDIIQFIAQERLDFAMRHIIFDLLSVDRSIKMIMSPERMNIGLQAFLVIADNLQQKEGDPAMPISIGSASAQQLAQIMHSNPLSPVPSLVSYQQQQHDGGTFGPRRACALKMLNDDTAKSIGLHPYYNHIQKSFNEILKALDIQFGRPLMLTSVQTINKEPDDMISGDRKLKVELFRTCIAAIPRIMPDGMSKADLIDLLSRMTIHIDEQMRKYAFESLQKLVIEFQDWRLDAIEGFTLFLANQIDESLRTLVDGALRMLLQLLISWHSIIKPASSSTTDNDDLATSGNKPSPIVMIQTGYETISSRNSGTGGQIVARKNRALAEMRLIQSELSNTRFDRLINVIQKVEGASLVMSCSCHSATRKLASLLLRECRAILKCYSSWTCMEHFGFRSPDDGEEEDMSVSMKGSISADNLSRITTTSINGLVSSSMTSMNTQAMLSTSVSKMCISSAMGQQQQHQQLGNLINSNSATTNNNSNQHDLYDEDIENNLADCYSNEENSTLVFWVAVMMLDSNKEHEYTLALSLLRKILPNMPFEKEEFLEELDRNLRLMEWEDYPGIHSLVLKRCTTANAYDVCISLLDHMTPILKHSICTGVNNKPADWLPAHMIVLSTQLLATYEDPPSSSLNIARRLALCCEENSQKLENLSAVMTLYSRRSFSKDAFQWIKCVAKYLHDACPNELPNTIPLLLEMLESGPRLVQRLTLPILFCILTYVDLNATPPSKGAINFNGLLVRLYNKCLGTESLWRDAMQIFRLIISKSSSLANGTTGRCHELPGRTMEFTVDIDDVPMIAKSRLAEFGVTPNVPVCSATKQLQQQQPPTHLAVDSQA